MYKYLSHNYSQFSRDRNNIHGFRFYTNSSHKLIEPMPKHNLHMKEWHDDVYLYPEGTKWLIRV